MRIALRRPLTLPNWQVSIFNRPPLLFSWPYIRSGMISLYCTVIPSPRPPIRVLRMAVAGAVALFVSGCVEVNAARYDPVSSAIESGCSYGEWNSPRSLSKPSPTHIRWPSSGMLNGRGFVIGNDVPTFDEKILHDSFTGLTAQGEVIGRPEGDFQYVLPKVVIDKDGYLHMVWAEAEDGQPIARKDWPPHWRSLTSLWHASYSDAEGWSIPERILEHQPGLVWGDQFATFSVDKRGHPMLPVVLFPGQLVLLRLTTSWTLQKPPEENAYGYSRAAQLQDGTILITYLGSDGFMPGGENSIMLIRSTTDGESWLDPSAIKRSSVPAFQNPQILAGKGDTAHLFWTRTGLSGALFDGIEHAYTTDLGLTWHHVGDIPGSSQRKDFHAAIDYCGIPHVIFNSWRANHDESEVPAYQNVLYTYWSSTWQDPVTLFREENVHSPDLTWDAKGSLYLFWSSVEGDDTGRMQFRPRVAELPIGRSAEP